MTDEEKQAKIAALRALNAKETQTQAYIQAAIDRLNAGEEAPAADAKADAIGLMKIPEVQRSAYKAALILGANAVEAKAIAAELLPENKPKVVEPVSK